MASSYVGRVVNGRYGIRRLLGEGGMGGVYEAEHLDIGKRVAIKIVHALHARDPHVAARIRQEARSTGALESENVVQVFDAGDDEAIGIYLVMELLKGEDLASLLSGGRRVSPVAAATMVLQAAQGLSRAHAAGIVHRDLKPANVFLSTRDDGSSIVKLVDFGIAKLVRDASRANRGPGLTQAGMAIGTPHYMSPEQAQGLATVDHRTDVYSLGAVLFEAIAGAPPFPELPTYEQTIVRIVTTAAPRLSSRVPEVDPRLDRLCAEMMARDPDARPADMGAVRARLLAIFPEIERARLEINFRDDDVQLDAVPPSSHLVPAVVSRSGSAIAARPSLPPPVSFPSIPVLHDAPIADADPPPRRRGAPYYVAMGVVALSTIVCVLALFQAHRRHEATASLPSFGLVESTVVAAPPAVSAPTPAALEPPPAAATASAAPSSTAPAPEPEANTSRPAPPPSPSRATPRKKTTKYTSGPIVGGTSESTEF